MDDGTDRRDFLKTAAGVGLALAGAPALSARGEVARGADEAADEYLSPEGFAVEPIETVRMAFVGVGLQGGSHVRNFLQIEGVEIKALCDVDAPRAQEVAGWVTEKGRSAPDLYTRG